ncbi:hypothetical protein [Roseibium sp. SCP14]|uniref:hypothetical protein n=1 Tax=Roseibium sp. SCP14 TaxID=3141375 RepID=UPI0033360024
MRSLLIAFLITIFAGVHTAAALSAGQADVSGITSQQQLDTMVIDTVEMGMAHHTQCCSDADTSGGAGSLASCSVDCGTFYLVDFSSEFVSEATVEIVPLASFLSVILRQPDHPPKQR